MCSTGARDNYPASESWSTFLILVVVINFAVQTFKVEIAAFDGALVQILIIFL